MHYYLNYQAVLYLEAISNSVNNKCSDDNSEYQSVTIKLLLKCYVVAMPFWDVSNTSKPIL